MSMIQCQQCQKKFNTVSPELSSHVGFDGHEIPHSYICPFCGFDNRETEKQKTNAVPSVTDQAPSVAETTTPSQVSSTTKTVEQNVKRKKCAWEADWKTNPIQAYWETVKSIITNPVEYFGHISPFENMFSLGVFVYINYVIAIFFSIFYQASFYGGNLHYKMSDLPFLFCGVFFFPILCVLIVFFLAWILHLFFGVIGGSKKDYETTATVYGLSTVSGLFGVVPFLGGLASFVYTVIINIFGQAKAHEIDSGKAALAAIVPFLICCCLIGGVIALVMIFAVPGNF